MGPTHNFKIFSPFLSYLSTTKHTLRDEMLEEVISSLCLYVSCFQQLWFSSAFSGVIPTLPCNFFMQNLYVLKFKITGNLIL